MTMAEPDTQDDVPLETIVNASPFTFNLNREEIVARLVKAETALALCVEALEAVEWTDAEWCEWCKRHEADGHFADCLRERALAAAKGD